MKFDYSNDWMTRPKTYIDKDFAHSELWECENPNFVYAK